MAAWTGDVDPPPLPVAVPQATVMGIHGDVVIWVESVSTGALELLG